MADPSPIIVQCATGGNTRRTRLVVGWRYRCQPLHPGRTKNAGRSCILRSFDFADLPMVRVFWEDVKRSTDAHVQDFVEAEGVRAPGGEAKLVRLDLCWKDATPGMRILVDQELGIVVIEDGYKVLRSGRSSASFGALKPIRQIHSKVEWDAISAKFLFKSPAWR